MFANSLATPYRSALWSIAAFSLRCIAVRRAGRKSLTTRAQDIPANVTTASLSGAADATRRGLGSNLNRLGVPDIFKLSWDTATSIAHSAKKIEFGAATTLPTESVQNTKAPHSCFGVGRLASSPALSQNCRGTG
jgi:hypothetical protein